jgi:HEAT repeat protein
MDVLHAARLYAANTAWKLSGSRPAGRVLVRALDSRDESVRAIAGMFLVQSGERAVPLLTEALAERRSVPVVLTILGDIGAPEAEPVIEDYRSYPDPEVARAARDALSAYAIRARTARA